MVFIFRVEMKFCDFPMEYEEHKHPYGPYTYGRYKLAVDNGFEWVEWVTDESYQPEPIEDGLKNWQNKHFGFKSIQQFFNWFNCDINRLNWAGFHLVKYEVSQGDLVYGKSQICFNMSKANPIEFYDIPDLVLEKYEELTTNFSKYLIYGEVN